MTGKLTRSDAHRIIEDFFRQTELPSAETKKIKQLAMKYNIKLGKHRTRFCEACYADLKKGSVRVTKTHKLNTCTACGKRIKWRHTGKL